MKDTVTGRLSSRAQALANGIEELLRKHSSMKRWKNGIGSGDVVIIAGDFDWNPLQPPGQQLQSKLNNDHEKYIEIMKVLLEGSDRSESSSNWIAMFLRRLNREALHMKAT